jgi:succinate dehydrogenase / fumarate reductase, cytochrome b subunit
MTKVAYYKGCLASLSAKELDISTQALAPKLGLELDELESVTCCGAGDIHEAEPDYYLHLNARILAYAEQTGCETLMTICNVCTLNLRRANKMVKEDARLLEQVNEELVKAGARPYEGTKEVTHLLWYLATEEGLSLLEKQGPRGLNGLRVAPYYGCQLLRPSSVMGFEDPDKPQSLERLITALGGEVADYEAKSKCCGFPIILAREQVALKESHVALSQSRDAGADCMVTPCPLCHLAMDAYQRKAELANATEYNMPVLHLPQLIGLALGIDTATMDFKRHLVPADRVLEIVGA